MNDESKIDLEINVAFQKANVEVEVRAFSKSLDMSESSYEIASPINANSNAPFFNSKKTKLINGRADFYYAPKIESLGSVEVIYGDTEFPPTSLIKDLGNLRIIAGNADFQGTKFLKTLKNLKTIAGYANFRNSQIENLGNLTTVLGDVEFFGSKVKDLGNLTTVLGNAYFNNSQVENLGNLTTVSGKIYVDDGYSPNPSRVTKEQIELHLKMMKEINIIKKGLYYISNGKVFIKPSVLVDNQHFFIRDLKFNDNGTIAMK